MLVSMTSGCTYVEVLSRNGFHKRAAASRTIISAIFTILYISKTTSLLHLITCR